MQKLWVKLYGAGQRRRDQGWQRGPNSSLVFPTFKLRSHRKWDSSSQTSLSFAISCRQIQTRATLTCKPRDLAFLSSLLLLIHLDVKGPKFVRGKGNKVQRQSSWVTPAVDWIATPEDVCTLISRTCEYVTFHSKSVITGVNNVIDLEIGSGSGLSRWPQTNHRSP